MLPATQSSLGNLALLFQGLTENSAIADTPAAEGVARFSDLISQFTVAKTGVGKPGEDAASAEDVLEKDLLGQDGAAEEKDQGLGNLILSLSQMILPVTPPDTTKAQVSLAPAGADQPAPAAPAPIAAGVPIGTAPSPMTVMPVMPPAPSAVDAGDPGAEPISPETMQTEPMALADAAAPPPETAVPRSLPPAMTGLAAQVLPSLGAVSVPETKAHKPMTKADAIAPVGPKDAVGSIDQPPAKQVARTQGQPAARPDFLEVQPGARSATEPAPEAVVAASVAVPADGAAGQAMAQPLMSQGAAPLPQTPQAPDPATAPLDTTAPTWEADFVDRITAQVMGEDAVIDIALTPDNLGAVEIRVEIRDGKAEVTFTTETREAARLFTQSEARLAELMSRNGLQMGSQDASQRQNQQPAAQTLTRRPNPSGAVPDAAFQNQPAASDGRLNVLA